MILVLMFNKEILTNVTSQHLGLFNCVKMNESFRIDLLVMIVISETI